MAGGQNHLESRWKKKLEIVLLISISLVVCTLFITPTILYALPPLNFPGEQALTNNLQDGGSNVSHCHEWKNYTGDICYNELKTYQSCYDPLFGLSNMIHVPFETNQEKAEATATTLLQGLPLLSPSQECEAAIKPFLCLYLFGSCDSNNQSHQATRADCLRLKENICAEEWVLAERYLGQGILPDCNALQDKEIDCQSLNVTLLNSTIENIMCAEGYYLSDDNVCRPLCSNWVEPSKVESDYIAVVATVVICVLSSILLIILATTVQRKTMLMFPTYYLVYISITAFIIGLLLLTGLATKGNLFCSSDDLLHAFVNETAYCTFSGVLFTYGLAQLGLFILFHAVGLCWGVVFPFHFRKFKAEEKLKYIHVTTVLIALFLPTVPALLHLEKGYGIASSPTTICFGRSVAVTFFSLILPLSVVLAITTSVFVIIFWIIFKDLILKKSTNVALQGRDRARDIASMRKAEAKILFIVCYYVLLGTLVLTLFTHFEATSNGEQQIIERHFSCQSSGLQSGKDCGATPQDHLTPVTSLTAVAIVLTGLLPLVIIVFTVQWKCKAS